MAFEDGVLSQWEESFKEGYTTRDKARQPLNIFYCHFDGGAPFT